MTGPEATPLPGESSAPANSLRSAMDDRRSNGERFSLREVIAIIVPLSTDLAARHARGERFYLYPSAVTFMVGQPASIHADKATSLPKSARDRACVAPEERSGKGGDACSTVFSIGAIVYEMLTGEVVGPGMRRPTQIVRHLPDAIDGILSRALIGDPQHRPTDVGALAQALHHFAPTASQAPPPADETSLDGGGDIEVDVSLSMLPPPPLAAGTKIPKPAALPADLMRESGAGLVGVADAPKSQRQLDPTARLADLKARLESDPRPRYVVIKDGMDHGPFTAIELLQQLASHTFESHHILVDSFSSDERPVHEWEEFAPFAEQSKLNRQIVAEKKEIERVVVAEGKATTGKAMIIGAAIAGVAVIAGIGFLAQGRIRRADAEIMGDHGLSIESDAGLKGSTKASGPSGGPHQGGPSSGGSYPVLKGGMSCEQAMNTYTDEIRIGGGSGKADLTAGAFGSVLNNGSYVIACGAPASMTVKVCAAVQNGRAVGVSVSTDPSNPGISSCIAGRVRGMSFPSSAKLDVSRTEFKGQ